MIGQQRRMETPWGTSQTSDEITEGITRVSTASHGGYFIDMDRAIAFKEKFPYFKTFTGERQWFEEDQDWAMVALAFPDYFTDEMIRGAVLTVEFSAKMDGDYGRPRWRKVAAWLEADPRGRALRARAAKVEEEHKDDWEAGGGASHKDGWITMFTRVRDKARTERLGDYPRKQFYTDEELARDFREIPKPETKPTPIPQTDAFGRGWNDSRSLEDCHSDADPGL